MEKKNRKDEWNFLEEDNDQINYFKSMWKKYRFEQPNFYLLFYGILFIVVPPK